MLPMHKAAIRLAALWGGRASMGMIRQQGEGCIETTHVGFADFLAKLGEAELVYLVQVGNRSIAEFDVSHALCVAWR